MMKAKTGWMLGVVVLCLAGCQGNFRGGAIHWDAKHPGPSADVAGSTASLDLKEIIIAYDWRPAEDVRYWLNRWDDLVAWTGASVKKLGTIFGLG